MPRVVHRPQDAYFVMMGKHDHHLHDGESLRDAAARRMAVSG